MSAANPAIISIIGSDQKGVVARVSTYLAEHNVNLTRIESRPQKGEAGKYLFFLDMEAVYPGLAACR